MTQNVVLIPFGTGTSFTLNTTNLPGYNGLIDKIECIGGGGSGLPAADSSTNLTGGGGGAYALSTAVSIALNTTVTIQIGAGATTGATAGTDTWFNGASLAVSSCGAKGGGGASNAAGGTGGAAGSCVFSGSGSQAFSGGAGGGAGATGTSGGGGGAGPLGAGGAGGIGNATSTACGGGGGNGGGSAGAAGGATNGGGGGNNQGGSGGGSAGTTTVAAGAGTNGGGGGGAADSGPGTGGNGAEGTEWTLTAGGTAGSGGGGGGGIIGNASGNGAVGGGGGAGGGTTGAAFGSGGNGFIVLTYTPSGGGGAALASTPSVATTVTGTLGPRHDVSNLVQESTTSPGTGAFALAGALTGFQAFGAVMNDQDTCLYMAQGVTSGAPSGPWEIGIGTYNASGNTLSRTQVLKSSNANALVNFTAAVNISLTEPAEALWNKGCFNNGPSGSAITIDWSRGPYQMVVLTANCTLTFVNSMMCPHAVLELYQDQVGSRVPTLSGAAYRSGSPPTWSTAANAHDTLDIHYNIVTKGLNVFLKT